MAESEEKKGEDGQTEPVYGGCEGPNAMYVKLISSDNHEFIINRDYALTSGTIKAMLSGPGKLNKFNFALIYDCFSVLVQTYFKIQINFKIHSTIILKAIASFRLLRGALFNAK